MINVKIARHQIPKMLPNIFKTMNQGFADIKNNLAFSCNEIGIYTGGKLFHNVRIVELGFATGTRVPGYPTVWPEPGIEMCLPGTRTINLNRNFYHVL